MYCLHFNNPMTSAVAVDLGPLSTQDAIFVTCRTCNHVYGLNSWAPNGARQAILTPAMLSTPMPCVEVLPNAHLSMGNGGIEYNFQCPRCGMIKVAFQDVLNVSMPGLGGILSRYYCAVSMMAAHAAQQAQDARESSELPHKKPRPRDETI